MNPAHPITPTDLATLALSIWCARDPKRKGSPVNYIAEAERLHRAARSSLLFRRLSDAEIEKLSLEDLPEIEAKLPRPLFDDEQDQILRKRSQYFDATPDKFTQVVPYTVIVDESLGKRGGAQGEARADGRGVRPPTAKVSGMVNASYDPKGKPDAEVVTKPISIEFMWRTYTSEKGLRKMLQDFARVRSPQATQEKIDQYVSVTLKTAKEKGGFVFENVVDWQVFRQNPIPLPDGMVLGTERLPSMGDTEPAETGTPGIVTPGTATRT